jgi:hypothetical protein
MKAYKLATLSLACALAACGGGGDNDGGGPQVITAADAQLLAGLGFVTLETLSQQLAAEQGFLATFLQGYSTGAASGSGSSSVSCISGGAGSGSLASTVTKAGTYQGLRTNDVITLNFSNCQFGTSALIIKGSVTLTALSNMQALNATNFAANYITNSFNFSLGTAGRDIIASGIRTVTYDALARGVSQPRISTTQAINYNINIGSGVVYTLRGGTSFTHELFANNAFSTSYAGTIGYATTSGSFDAVLSANNLAGAYNSGSRPIPTSGSMAFNIPSEVVYTSSTITNPLGNVNINYNADTSSSALNRSTSSTYLSLTAF